MTDKASRGTTVEKGSSGFGRNVLTLGAGTLVAQLISVLVSPIITRLFDPSALGLAAVFAATVGTLALAACLKYEAALMLPESDEEAASLFGLCWLLLGATTVFVALATAAFASPLLVLLNASELEPYRGLVPISFFLLGAGYPLRLWYSRNKHFQPLAQIQVGEASATAGVTIVSGLAGLTSGGDLIVARMVSQTLRPLFLGWRVLRRDIGFVLAASTPGRMWRGARRYKNFPAFSLWSELLNGVSRELPTIFLAGYFGASSAGLFVLAQRIILMPGALVSGATGQVLFQRASEMRGSRQDLAELLEAIIRRLVLIGMLPLVVLTIAGPELFHFVFGDQWADAGAYSRLLAPWVFTMFVASPLSVLWNVLERQRLALVVNLALTSSRLGALAFGGLVLHEVLPSLAMFSAVGVVFNLGVLAFFVHAVGARWRSILFPLGSAFSSAALCAVVLGYCKYGLNGSDALIVSCTLLVAAVYGGVTLRSDVELWRMVTRAAKTTAGSLGRRSS